MKTSSNKRTVLLAGTAVNVRKARGRTLRLTVHQSGRVVLAIPYFVSYKVGLAWLGRHASWLTRKKKELVQGPPRLLDQGSREEFETLKAQARELVTIRLAYYQEKYGVAFESFKIRNQRSRWGSCSRGGRANFNYRILFLPERLQDYVIVHELCHLREFNHSRAFWALVAMTLPDYPALRRALHQAHRKEP